MSGHIRGSMSTGRWYLRIGSWLLGGQPTVRVPGRLAADRSGNGQAGSQEGAHAIFAATSVDVVVVVGLDVERFDIAATSKERQHPVEEGPPIGRPAGRRCR